MKTMRVPATSANLGPGFDCMGLALNCYNYVEYEFIDSGLIIELSEKDKAIIPSDENNLIFKVFERTLKKMGITVPGLHIVQRNNIPVVRGLGSSAACVVAGVELAGDYCNGKLSLDDKIELCAIEDGHPDNVLPALLGGITIGAMDETTVKHTRVSAPKNMRLVAFIPPFELSTLKARQVLPQSVSLKDAVFNLSHAALLASALITGELSLLSFAMKDKLHEQYRRPLVPGYSDIEKLAEEHGALTSYLSGAGPTIIAIWDNEISDFNNIAASAAKLGWEAADLTIDEEGVKVLEQDWGTL